MSLGLGHEGVYRKNGAKSRIKVLMDEFRRDARNVKLRIGEHFIEDVTDVLKRFFRELEDPVFMAELHPQWQDAASESSPPSGLGQYGFCKNPVLVTLVLSFAPPQNPP